MTYMKEMMPYLGGEKEQRAGECKMVIIERNSKGIPSVLLRIKVCYMMVEGNFNYYFYTNGT